MERIDLPRVIGESRRDGETSSMQRNIIIAFGIIILLLASALAFLLFRGQPSRAPIEVEAAEQGTASPYRQEMECIDRLIQRNDLLANQVEAELAHCRGADPRSEAIGR